MAIYCFISALLTTTQGMEQPAGTINAFARKAAKATIAREKTRREATKAAEDIPRLMIDVFLSQGTQDKSLLTRSIPFNVCMNAGND